MILRILTKFFSVWRSSEAICLRAVLALEWVEPDNPPPFVGVTGHGDEDGELLWFLFPRTQPGSRKWVNHWMCCYSVLVTSDSLGELREKSEASRRQLMSKLQLALAREEFRDCLWRERRWTSWCGGVRVWERWYKLRTCGFLCVNETSGMHSTLVGILWPGRASHQHKHQSEYSPRTTAASPHILLRRCEEWRQSPPHHIPPDGWWVWTLRNLAQSR